MNENKTIAIYSMRLAGLLMQKGFVLIDMQPHLDGSGKNVFFFKDSPALKEVVKNYKAR